MAPKIVLYTNHASPWSHRANIALAELKAQLGIEFREEIVDLTKPRTEEYLKINPRGLVPALSYGDEILTESAVIATFLANLYPESSLLPASTLASGPLTRARISFFADTYLTKVVPVFSKVNMAKSPEERSKNIADFVDVTAKELDPLLANAGPFFGGSRKLTLAEVLVAPFILRLYIIVKHGMLPKSLLGDLASKAPNFDKWAQNVIASPSVIGPFSDIEETWVGIMKQKAAAAQAAAST